MKLSREIGPFSLKHMFAVAGFVATAIAIIVLTIFYRDMIVRDIVIQGERQNQLLAQTALNSVRHELIRFLHRVNRADTLDPKKITLPPMLNDAIQTTLSNNYVTRIRIYSSNGMIVFSTAGLDTDQEMDETGFTSAISGKIKSNLVLDDLFNFRRGRTEVDNLVETYLPVREAEDKPILGVFEIYTDVNSIVKEVRHTEIVIILGVILVLFFLYSLLTLIVSRAANTIDRQQAIIRERTRTLELLSSQLINAQEDEKKSIAHDLHENVAQTLATVKNVIETALSKQSGADSGSVGALKKSIKILQESISDIRSLAMDLRPPSLDDFGLIKTLDWLCRQYRSWFPEMTIETEFADDTPEISDSLKTVIYRVVQEALESLGLRDGKQSVHIKLGRDGNVVTLTIEESYDKAVRTIMPGEGISSPLLNMKQRTLLSGGSFEIGLGQDGEGIIATASWQIS